MPDPKREWETRSRQLLKMNHAQVAADIRKIIHDDQTTAWLACWLDDLTLIP